MKRFEAENYLPISHLPGLGDIMINRLMDAGFMYAQDLVNADMEKLTEVEGIGEKKATTLIETAKIQVAEFEERRRQELEAAQAEGETDEEYEEEEVVGEPESEQETTEASDIEERPVEHAEEEPEEEQTEEAVDDVVQEGVAPDTEELDAPDWEEESEKESQ